MMIKLLVILMFVFQVQAFEFVRDEFGVMPETSGRIVIGDLNRDGYNDLISNGISAFIRTGRCVTGYCAGSSYEKPLKIWLNNQKGGFVEKPQLIEFRATSEQYEGVTFVNHYEVPYTAIADLDSDGDNDIVSSSGLVFLNNGDEVFTKIEDVGFPFNNSPIYATDLNNDGVHELITNGKIYSRSSIQPLRYMSVSESSMLNGNLNLAIQDINNDEFNDIITYGNDTFVKIWINDQSGSYPEDLAISLNEKEPLHLLVADIGNDTNFDIVLSGNRILKNKGNLVFELEELIANFVNRGDITEITPINLVNYNDDNYLDLLFRAKFYDNENYQDIILFNNGSDEYQFNDIGQVDNTSIQFGAEFILFYDFNSDGLTDILSTKTSESSQEYQIHASSYENGIQNYLQPTSYQFNLNLYINETNGKNYPSPSTILNYSDFYLFDVNFDGDKELLFSNYKFNPHDIYSSNSFNNNPFYLSNLIPNKINVSKFNLDFHTMNRSFKYIIPFDLNNDDKDDLVVNYKDCIDFCIEKIEVLFNSNHGFSIESPLELDFDPQNYFNADINGDGYKDFIKISKINNLSNSILFQENINGSSFVERAIHIPEFDSVISTVIDVNNDGFDDIFFIDTYSNLYMILGDQDLSGLSAKLVGVYDINKIAFYDTDFDGNKDLYYIENESNDLVWLEYIEGSFVVRRIIPTDIDDYIQNIKFADINNDGEVDLITVSDSHVKIYQYILFSGYKKVYEEKKTSKLSKVILHDFDGDSKIDIALNSRILFGRDFVFLSGLNYDPNHSGHGFSIEDVGNEQFFTVFYTYGNDGYPEWYTDLGLFEKPREDYWNVESVGNGLIRSEYDNTNQTISQNAEDNYIGLVEHDKCSDIYGEINLHFEIGIDRFGQPVNKDDWCSKPIVGYYQRPLENDLSGLWWAGSGDSGWGWSVSLVEREETTDIVVVLYYYDGEGNPRWLIGQQSGFEAGVEVTLNMNRVKGYPRWADPKDLELQSAGTMSLTLNQASRDLTQGGVLSIDVTYPGPEGGNWVRNNIPIALFSEPRH